MSDVNAKIGVQIDTSQALAELKGLQRQLALFHSSVAKGSASAAAQQRNMQQNLLNSINATGKFSAQMGVVRTSTESFTNALEKNKLSMREYFRYAGASTKTFGRLFKSEFDTIGKVAEERVRRLQTQYIKLGRDTSGAMKAISVTPTSVNMKDYGNQVAMAAQKQALFNQLVKQGSTNLLNFGKNTQWAGRQLMVGFTIPLAYLGTVAGKTFMDLEAQAIRFKRVYGDMFTTTEQTNKALDDVRTLAEEFTKYGVAVVDTMKMAADAAAMGKTGADLTAQVAQATRLAVLGGVEQGQALETTISITNAFGTAAEDLAKKINFLNAVENQTVVSIEDLTIAIPKAGPVVKQLGGDVEDLAFFLTAMKEGGINASEGANALKSGLAALINPTKKASEMLAGFGININAIVEQNQGNVRQTVIDFSRALDTLDPLNRARAIEQLFGKFQFSRLSTLFQNVTKDGTQASKVLGLTTNSVEQLAIMSERELGVLENAVGTKFKAAIQDLKLTLEPIGKTFLEAVTPVAQSVAKLLDKFNNLGDGTKKFIVVATTLVGVIGPVLLMTFGLLLNAVANGIKLFAVMRTGFLRLGGNSKILAEQTNFLTMEQLEAATVAASLNQAHSKLTQQFVLEASAIRALRQAYVEATVAAARFAATNPGMMMPGFKPGIKGGGTKGFASGTTGLPGPKGAGDIIPILAAPGEAIVPAKIAQDDRFKPIIEALVTGKIAKYEQGTTGVKVPQDLNPEGRAYNAKSARGAKDIQSFIDSLQKNPDGTYNYVDPKGEYSRSNIPASTISKHLNSRIESNKFTLSEIKTKLGLNKEGRELLTKKTGRTNAPRDVRGIIGKAGTGAIPGFEIEKQAIRDRLKQRGIAATQSQLDRLFQIDASHIKPEFDESGNKIWKAKNVTADAGYVNNYISNSLKGRLGQHLSQMSPDQLKSLGIDPKTFNDLYAKGSRGAGTHPVTTAQAQTLQAIARYVISKPKGLNLGKNALYQAHALDAGLGVRLTKTGFYTAGGPKTLEQLKLAVGRGEVVVDKQGRSKAVTASTGKPKGSTRVVGGGPSDKRIIPAKNVSRVIPRPGFRGPGSFALGAEKGFVDSKTGIPLSQAASQMAVGPRGLQKQRDQQKRQSDSVDKSIKATDDLTETTKTTKQQLSAFSQKAGLGIGAVSGLTIAASFAGGKVGEMAQAIMPFVFGLQGIVMLLPLLANPWVAAVAAIALVGGTLFKMNKDVEKARQEGINLANAMSMTSKKLVDLSVIAGTVSASEAANRRRQNLVSGTVDAQRRFGQNVLESEFGKGLLADIATQGKAGGTNKEIAKNIANQLATAVVQGAVTPQQAKSIASALGEQLGSYEIPLLVSGKIVNLIGPNGELLDREPLQVALAIKKESATNLAEAFNQAQNNRKSEGTIGQVFQSLLSGPLAVKAIINIGKSKQFNAKIDAATVQLGLEAINQNQQLVDGLNQQYDLKIKNAKTEQEIIRLQAQRKADLDKLNTANKQTINDVVSLSSQISAENFNKAIATSIDNLYKESSDAVKVFKDIAKDELNDLANTDFKKTIQIGFASGQLTPNAVIALLDASKQVPEIQTKIKTVVEKEGFANASTLLELISQTGAGAKTVDLMLNYINTNKVDFDKDMTALDILAKFQQKYGITLDLSVNGATQLMIANAALSKIATLPDKIDKTVVQKLAGANPELFADAVINFDKLSEGKSLIDKTLLVNYLVGRADPALIAAAKAAGLSVPEYIARGFNAAVTDIPGGKTPLDAGARKATVIDDLLLKLKLFRKESVNALGGWQELIKQLGSGKTINAFKGVTNQLQGAGGNESLVQFAEGLNAEEAGQFFDKITSKAKSGKLILNDYGKSLNRLFPTVQAGIYLRQQDQITREQTTQNKALAMLRARGVDAATALELTADAATAAAIISKDLDGKDLETMINRTKRATAETRKFEAALKAAQFEADELAEGAAEQLSEEFDYAFLEIERKQREIFKSVNKMTPEQVELSIAVDERAIDKIQDQINGINSQVKSYNRTLDLIGRQETAITETYDKKIESLNKQRDALESVKSINAFLISQQQKQLGLANALTQGDISAAAAAAQEMRAEAAQEAINRLGTGLDTATTNLEAQKQREISSITAVVNGQKLTRKQIEAQIVTLSDQIYNIEVSQLEPLQKQADAKRQLLSDLALEIDRQQKVFEKSGMTKAEWDLIQRYVEAANRKANTLAIDINAIASSSASAAASWKSILDSMRAAAALKASPMTGAQVLTGISEGTITKSSITLDQAMAGAKQATANINQFLAKFNTPQKKMYGGKVKYMAAGGMAVGSDTVPAMLTPGEFVVNKAAAQQFGPMLQSINESKYPSMLGGIGGSTIVPVNNVSTSMNDNSTAVYNYNLGFNINGNTANANEIARAVMREVKNVDAQRIRGQRQ